MIQAKIYKNERQNNQFLSSRKIETGNGILVLLQISFHDAKLGSFIENTIIDLILTNSLAIESDAYANFGYLLEKLNKYLKEIEKDSDFSDLSIFIGILQGESLHFSVLKNSFAYLVKEGKIMNIAEGMGLSEATPQFSYISSGLLNPGNTLCITNNNLLDAITEDDLLEIADSNTESESAHIIEHLLSTEIRSVSTDIIMLHNGQKPTSKLPISWDTSTLEKALKQTQDALVFISKKIASNEHVAEWTLKAKKHIDFNNKTLRSSLFGVGILVGITLLYLIISALFEQKANSTIPEAYKGKLIEAALIIEKSNKDLGNRDVFNANIKKAEALIFEVRDKQIFLNDVKKLLSDISILKKQINGIESFDPKTASSEYLFEGNNFGLSGIFEVSKKLYFVGKNSIIGPYVKGGEAKKYSYPDGEEAISSDANPEGQIYIFTKTGRLLRFYKGEFNYVSVEGQKTWEKGRAIKFFNSNLYILAEDGKQLYKHKPGVNGFASKTEVFEPADTKNHTILTFGIDGGFYILKEDLTIDKIFGLPNYTKRSIRINNLPENYALSGNETPYFFNAPNLNYFYLVLGNRVWIFEPDSRNYKDINAIRYVGQIEVVEGKIGAITVPKDGTAIVGTDTGVYTINFEVSDGKVSVR